MTNIKRIIAYLLIACLVITCIPPLEASAAENEEQLIAEEQVVAEDIEVLEDTAAEEEPEEVVDDGLLTRDPVDFGANPKERSVMAVDASSITHDSRFLLEYDIENGIDISHHNGKVNWDKVKAAGYDFAIIRMAYRGYGSAGKIKKDDNAIDNLEGALSAGLDVGVYFFSQAITKKEAVEEAKYILDIVEGYEFELPIVMDFEYSGDSTTDGRLYNAKLSKREKTDICLEFCKTIKAAGYDAMVYANKSMLTNGVYASEIVKNQNKIWLAHYTSSTDYKGDYTYWQYTSSGSVPGVPSERVDLNVRYVDAKFKITGRTYNSVSMSWKPVEGADGYIIYRKPYGGSYKTLAEVNGQTTSYKDRTAITNTKYYYYVRYYKLDENGEKQIFKTGYPYKSVKTPLKLQKLTAKGTAVDAGTVKISWNKDPNAQGYYVQRYNSSKKAYETIKNVTSGKTLSFTNTGRKIGTTYKYRVRSYAKDGGITKYGSYSEPVSVKTSSSLKKPVLTVKPYSYTTNKLSWKKVPGATGYKVQRYDSSKKKWVTVKTIKSGSTTSYSNTYLNCSTTYKYRVKATATLSGKTVSSYYSDTKAAKTKASRTAVVKNGPLNVRKGAGTKYGKLTQVKKGAKLTITGSTKSWYRVKIKVKGKYRTGYVLKKYVKLK